MVGHIMRLAAYLCTSRHGIFYFRFPMPMVCQAKSKRAYVKVSLCTREPREARHLARFPGVAGQAIVARPKVRRTDMVAMQGAGSMSVSCPNSDRAIRVWSSTACATR
jgi:hypothetical protein